MTITFPIDRPTAHTAFRRPEKAQTVSANPPGFSWWRAAPHGDVTYKVFIQNAQGETIYQGPACGHPAHVPQVTFSSGHYQWHVKAYDDNNTVCDQTECWAFEIPENCTERPWPNMEQTLADIAKRPHPRLHLPDSPLEDTRTFVAQHRKDSLEKLCELADKALSMTMPGPPDFSAFEGSSLRFAVLEFRDICLKIFKEGLGPLARAYALTGKQAYGEKAASLILGMVSWDIDGYAGLLSPHGDQPGLDIPSVTAETLDACWDLFSDDGREQVIDMIVKRMDQMMFRLVERDDYISTPGESHNGRMPPRLLEHAIVLADHPRAKAWADYALLCVMTTCPQWASHDGGWAEGISYAGIYGAIMMPGLRAWEVATGMPLRCDKYWSSLPEYVLYAFEPNSQLRPFGDLEYKQVARVTQEYQTNMPRILRSAARREQNGAYLTRANAIHCDPGVTWADLLDPLDPTELPLSDLPQDKCFHGVGHAFMHSNLGAKENMQVSFRSSPYGGVSHGHASQNDLLVQYDGYALLCPGGIRWPHHGTDFHLNYVRQSNAHNVILIDGQGQIRPEDRSDKGGRIVNFRSEADWAYVCGEAGAAYPDGLVSSWKRHLAFSREGFIILLDEVELPTAKPLTWLLHAPNKPERNGGTFTLKNGTATAHLKVTGQQTSQNAWSDTWPVDPMSGIKENIAPPTPIWHGEWQFAPAASHRILTHLCLDGVTPPGIELTDDIDSILDAVGCSPLSTK